MKRRKRWHQEHWHSSAIVATAIAVAIHVFDHGTAQAQSRDSVTGRVRGTVQLPDPSVRAEPPEQSHGFLPRRGNPILPTLRYNPLPWIIVVLEAQGELSPADRSPHKAPKRYQLTGESFRTPIFAATVGGEVAIANTSKVARRLVAPGIPDLIKSEPIGPGRDDIIRISTPHQIITIEARDSAHLVGRIVAFPHRYHSLVRADGRYSVDHVPPGKWAIRLWYREGWLKLRGSRRIVTVSAKRSTRANIALPDIIEVATPTSTPH